MTTDLAKRCTPAQIKRLFDVGIDSLYKLVTSIPIGYYNIIPLSKFKRDCYKTRYIVNADLLDIAFRRGSRSYYILKFRSKEDESITNAYLFATSAFISKVLKVGKEYQFLLDYRNNFWNIEKFALLKGYLTDNFIIGSAKISKHIDTYYSQQKSLSSQYLKSIFRRLKYEDFILNLKGLVPSNHKSLQDVINLHNIHFPISTTAYNSTLQDYNKFRLFLHLMVVKQADSYLKDEKALPIDFDGVYLKEVVDNLPFVLSDTQYKTVENILNEMKIDKS